jgi:heat shock protein HtpX
MASLYAHKESNIRKTWLLFTVFFIVVIGIGWLFARIYGNPGILYIAVMFSVTMSFISYWWSDRIVLSLHRARPVTMENAPELYRIVENLAITAGLPMPKVYLVPEAAPNAFATGRDPKHAVIAVTQGLVERLDRSELEGVLAHELSHIGNRDMLLGTVAVVLVGFVSILSDMFLRSMFWGGGRRKEGNESGAGGILVLAGLILAILAPLAATLIQLAISRKREFLADASGALLTRYPEGLASALEKISASSIPMRTATNTTAHLWFADPFRGKSALSRLHRLFMTHPPIEERIRALRNMSL